MLPALSISSSPKRKRTRSESGHPYTLSAGALAMSATHFEHNPLMCRYFREAGHSRKELAKRCGVIHYRI